MQYEETFADYRVRIYPNPTKGHLKVEVAQPEPQIDINITLYNASGVDILEYKTVQSSFDINISDEVSGIYIMKIKIGEWCTEWKIIKQ